MKHQLPQPSEDRIQATIFQHIHNYYPESRGCVWHVPNGGSRHRIEAAKLKGMGVVSGIADINVLWLGRYYAIELKDHKGRATPAQKFIHAKHASHGVITYLVRTIEDGIALIVAIITGQGLQGFTHLRSPYADATKLDEYTEEYKQHKAKETLRARARSRTGIVNTK